MKEYIRELEEALEAAEIYTYTVIRSRRRGACVRQCPRQHACEITPYVAAIFSPYEVMYAANRNKSCIFHISNYPADRYIWEPTSLDSIRANVVDIPDVLGYIYAVAFLGYKDETLIIVQPQLIYHILDMKNTATIVRELPLPAI